MGTHDDFNDVSPTNILSYYVMSAQPLGISWQDFLNTELKTMLSLITLSQVYKTYQYSEQLAEQQMKDNRK